MIILVNHVKSETSVQDTKVVEGWVVGVFDVYRVLVHVKEN